MGPRVVLEVAPKRAFASALDWPGWSRGGKTAEEALDSLLAYAPRYAVVARRAKVAFKLPKTLRALNVVETLHGDGGTEFGVPSVAASAEEDALSATELKRVLALLRASWAALDAVGRKAEGVVLATGPRGGGRDLDRILAHVREAERSYTAQLGGRAPASTGPSADAFIDAVDARNRGELPDRGPRGGVRWSPRYAVRRAAWHVLDHAWEIEDRSS